MIVKGYVVLAKSEIVVNLLSIPVVVLEGLVLKSLI
jgi:hypothetical protein